LSRAGDLNPWRMPSYAIRPDVRTSALESVAERATWVLISVASEVVRLGVSTMLATLPEVEAVLERSDLATTLEMLDSGTITVVLTSPPLPGEDYCLMVEAAARGKTRILVLLRDYDVSDGDLITQAVSLPADGYILESGLTGASLADALHQLSHGRSPMPAMLARGLVARLRVAEPEPAQRPFLLTARELQVLALMVDGQTNKEISTRLKVSEHGAKRHVACVLAKLNCSNRTAAVALVLQKGIVNFR
jgi:two-component system, NarL family, nitrate/nitrite response regulator NarL